VHPRSFVAVVLAGLLTSNLMSWGILHPTLWTLDHDAQVRAEKLMYRRFPSVDPLLIIPSGMLVAAPASTQAPPPRCSYRQIVTRALEEPTGGRVPRRMPLPRRCERLEAASTPARSGRGPGVCQRAIVARPAPASVKGSSDAPTAPIHAKQQPERRLAIGL
jgi:hypothetical protein